MLGYRVWLAADATATFAKTGYDGQVYDAETIHRTALASLHEEFAIVTTTEAVLAQLTPASRSDPS